MPGVGQQVYKGQCICTRVWPHKSVAKNSLWGRTQGGNLEVTSQEADTLQAIARTALKKFLIGSLHLKSGHKPSKQYSQPLFDSLPSPMGQQSHPCLLPTVIETTSPLVFVSTATQAAALPSPHRSPAVHSAGTFKVDYKIAGSIAFQEICLRRFAFTLQAPFLTAKQG